MRYTTRNKGVRTPICCLHFALITPFNSRYNAIISVINNTFLFLLYFFIQEPNGLPYILMKIRSALISTAFHWNIDKGYSYILYKLYVLQRAEINEKLMMRNKAIFKCNQPFNDFYLNNVTKTKSAEKDLIWPQHYFIIRNKCLHIYTTDLSKV